MVTGSDVLAENGFCILMVAEMICFLLVLIQLKVVQKWVGLGRVQNFMLIVGQVGSGRENWTHVQL